MQKHVQNYPRTVIRMGASRFDLKVVTEDGAKPITMDLRKAREWELGEVAKVICQTHNITGPKVKAKRTYKPRTPRTQKVAA